MTGGLRSMSPSGQSQTFSNWRVSTEQQGQPSHGLLRAASFLSHAQGALEKLQAALIHWPNISPPTHPSLHCPLGHQCLSTWHIWLK